MQVCRARGGAHERDAQLLAASDSLRERVGGTVPPSDRAVYDWAVSEIRGSLEGATFEAAWETGGRLELADAAAYARTNDPAV